MTVTVELASDVGTLIRGKETINLVEKSISNKLLDIEIGEILASKSSLKQEDINELDHIIKKGLYERVKSEQK
jgi:hypothetical protein